MISLSLRLQGHIEHNSVSELLRDSDYDMNLGFSLTGVLGRFIEFSASRRSNFTTSV